MIKFINKLTGTIMYVADEREQEYKEAGHVPASDSKPEVKKPTKARTKKAEV